MGELCVYMVMLVCSVRGGGRWITTILLLHAGLQFLHCLRFEGTGGQSILVDGFKIAEVIHNKSPEQFKILSTVPFSYQFVDGEHKYFNSNPALILDSQTRKVKRVHFNELDRLPLNSTHIESLKRLGIESGAMHKIHQAIQTFVRTMRDDSLVYKFQLEPGKLLVFNNHRVLHARTAFTGIRELCGCYVNKEDYHCKLAVLRDKYNWLFC